MSDLLKEKSRTALFWNFIDKGGQQIIQFIFLMILARLLKVEDFGLVALLTIFQAIANILQESGFSSALIRKKDADQLDYSSVFYFNISLSLLIYILFFFAAPLIASYYDAPILTNLSRFIFISFIFNAFGIIQNVHLTKKMDFRSNTKITFVAGILGGIVAIYAAFSGYGVWSLAIQQVIQIFLRNLLLWVIIKWRPSAIFSMKRLKGMMSYSSKLLFSSIFNQVGGYIFPLVIGKYFSFTQVGYYTQGYRLNFIPQSIIASSLQGVAFPLLSKLDNEERMKRVFRKIIRVAVFICCPVAALIIIAADPIVRITLSDKYLPSIPILQILAISGIAYPLFVLTGALMQALGKSGLLLKTELIRNILLIASVFITFRFGVLGLVTGFSTAYVVSFLIAFYFSGRSISYSLKEMAKDILPYAVISVVIFTPLYFINRLIDNNILLLILQSVTGGSIYLLIVKLLGSKVMEDFLEFFKKKNTNA